MDSHGKSPQRGLDMLSFPLRHARARKSSPPPYNSHHRHGVKLYLLERTAWLPAEAAIPRHNSGHLGDVLIITCYLQNAYCVPRTFTEILHTSYLSVLMSVL